MWLATGFAAAMPALTGLAMSGARAEDAGLASGLFNTMQVVGGSLGLAALSVLAAGHTDGLLADACSPVAPIRWRPPRRDTNCRSR